MASLLLSVLRPGEAWAASVSADRVRLNFAFHSTEMAVCDIEEIQLQVGRHWTSMRLRHPAGASTVSGLTLTEARNLANAVQAVRIQWWRGWLAPRVGAIRSVHDRVAELADPPKFVDADALSDIRRAADTAVEGLSARGPDAVPDDPGLGMLRRILEFLQAPGDARNKANEAFVKGELARSHDLFDEIEEWPLTDEQRRAVVIDGRRNLVVAAAGSGKTSVLVAKAGWLVQRGFRKPSELLLLAFGRDAKKEMQDRVCKRLDTATARGITVSTFHGLGTAIIGHAEGKRPTLAATAEDNQALLDLLDRIVKDLLADGSLSANVIEWFQDQFAPYESIHEFSSWGAYYDYIRRYGIRSLRGEKVKSFEECEIANFLHLRGVAYKYEAPYEYSTATAERRQYNPDFHLPDHGIYIEHFGLDAAGNTASFVDREEYLRDMAWKRQVHAENGTILVETFSHERQGGRLIRNLVRKLAAHGVTLASIPPDRVFAILNEQRRLRPFTQLLATFLQHFKGSRLSFHEVAERVRARGGGRRAEAFLQVFRPLYERYQETLSRAGEIDFHDMINRATDHLEAGRCRSPFGYILVDEFQDISPSRARLLQALLDSSPGVQLFAVGDDWQAIHRFAGADIAVMREFEQRFGRCEEIKLETTFRCSDRIASVATKFVLRNPSQIRKGVRACRKIDRPAVQVGLPGDNGNSPLKEALDRIADDAARHEAESKVLLMGRYQHLRPNHLGSLEKQYPGLRFSYKTVHAAKGAGADYAVVRGMCAGSYGFPAEIEDDPLLESVLTAPEAHPNAEERRVFYVALTRARRMVFLLAEGGAPSTFVRELMEGGYDIEVFGRLPEDDVHCPLCKEGRLQRRENPRDRTVFYSCSNRPYCERWERPCPICGTGLPVRSDGGFRCRDCGGAIEACPACDGWLESRMGQFGRFLGCSNYPACNYTRNLWKPRAEA